MEYTEARHQIIQTWGQLSDQWGISRSTGQIHALLMIAPEPLTADQIIAELGMSRGSVSMNLRTLMEWGVVYKTFIHGDRREYYASEKDVWKMALTIARERKRKELEPLIASLQTLQVTEAGTATAKQVEELNAMSEQVLDVAMQIDKVLEVGIRSGSQSLVRKLISVLKS